MRVLMTRAYPEKVVTTAQSHFEVEIREESAPLKVGQMRGALALYDGIMPTLGDAFSAKVFAESANPRCKVIANFGVGYNHIDVAAARAAGVAVTNTPGAVTDATADIALTLMLMATRRAAEGERLVRSGKWAGWHPTQMLGMHLTGKTVGIIGMGRIGQAIARRCHFGFDMKVLYHSRSNKDLAYKANRTDSLDALTEAADVIVLAVPGGAETRHLFGKAQLRSMKPGAYLINVSRGDVIDEAALISALEKGQIAGAGLDVYEHEPDVPKALRALDNVCLLPHLGTAALEVREAMGLMAVENLRVALSGEDPPNLLN